MGWTKKFAMQLSRYIYGLYMKDDAIIKAVKSSYPGTETEYIKEQIKAVRDNPKIFKEMH